MGKAWNGDSSDGMSSYQYLSLLSVFNELTVKGCLRRGKNYTAGCPCNSGNYGSRHGRRFD